MIHPIIATVYCDQSIILPKLKYLSTLSNISTVNEYIVKVLWSQQNLKTWDKDKIKIDGNTEQPTIVSMIINDTPHVANIV